MKHKTYRKAGSWLPEHVKISIRIALSANSAPSIEEAKAAALLVVKRQYPTLPMSDAELREAIDRVSNEAGELRVP